MHLLTFTLMQTATAEHPGSAWAQPLSAMAPLPSDWATQAMERQAAALFYLVFYVRCAAVPFKDGGQGTRLVQHWCRHMVRRAGSARTCPNIFLQIFYDCMQQSCTAGGLNSPST